MTRTSQLRRSLNRRHSSNRSESVQALSATKLAPRPHVPKRTTSLQPPVQLPGKPCPDKITLRTNTFIILDKIKNMKIGVGDGVDDEELYQV